MNCPTCSAIVPVDARFCSRCGQQIPASQPTQSLDWQAVRHQVEQLMKEQRYSEARLRLEQIAPLGGEARTFALYGLGVVAVRQGEPERARAYFHEVLNDNPAHQNSLFYLGTIAEKQGVNALAIDYYQRVTALNPAHASAIERIKVLRVAAATSNGGAAPMPPQRAGADPLLQSRAGDPGPVAPAGSKAATTGPAGPPPPPPVVLTPGANVSPSVVPARYDSVYAFLKTDKSLASTQAVALLDKVQFDTRPRITAYLGMLPIILPKILGCALVGFFLLIFGTLFLYGILHAFANLTR